MDNRTFILMVVYNKIQYDARVIRSAEALSNLSENIKVISCNSDIKFKNEKFKSIVYTSGLKESLLLFSFWIYIFKYSILNRNEIKLLYVHDYYLSYVGKIISKLIKVKWVYDAHELLLERKKYKHSSRQKFFKFLEKKAIVKADLVIAANEEREKIIKFIYKLKNTISVLNIAPQIISSNNNIGKEDFIVYQGAMTEGRNISYFIKILQYLPARIKLKLIGTGPDVDLYKKMVKELSLIDRVIFTGMIPYSQILNESKNCKLGIVYYKLAGLNNFYCSPNKIYEYAQLQIPMLVSTQPFLKQITTKYHIGEVLEISNNIEEHACLIIKIMNNHASYEQGMIKFLSDFTYENEMRKLQESISSII